MQDFETMYGKSISKMFPKSSFKYGILIPVLALLIDGAYVIDNKKYIVDPAFKASVESICFYRDGNGNVVWTKFPKIKKDLNYIENKKYASINFLIGVNGSVGSTTVNITKSDNLNRSINQICNLIGLITDAEKAEFHQILSSTRMLMLCA